MTLKSIQRILNCETFNATENSGTKDLSAAEVASYKNKYCPITSCEL